MGTPQDPGLRFVISTGTEKPDPELRKVIRSHVMRKKNLGRLLPPRKRKERRPQDETDFCTDALQTVVASEVPVPRKFGFFASAVTFADSIEPQAVDVFLKFSYIAKQVLFPLEPCILFEGRAESWIAPLQFDAAFLHCMIFSAHFYFDAIASRQISGVTPHFTPQALPYYKKTLDLLKKRLFDQNLDTWTSYTTLSMFNILACHAYVTGSCETAKHYVECLHRLVTLRGGAGSFNDNPKLLAEILKSDISISLHSGLALTFFNSQEYIPTYPDLASFLRSGDPAGMNPLPFFSMNTGLSQVWRRMSEFCSVINLAADSGQLITTQIFLQSMASVVYPLLHMKFESHSNDEAIRLTLLALSSSVFLPWRQLGLSYPYLKSQLKACLLQLDTLTPSPAQITWILMTSAVSVFDNRDSPWLQSLLFVNITSCNIHSWSAMRNSLKSFLWIDLVHDGPGRSIFESIIRREQTRPVVSSMPAVDVSEISNHGSNASY